MHGIGVKARIMCSRILILDHIMGPLFGDREKASYDHRMELRERVALVLNFRIEGNRA
jgi:hypothetical protein